MTKLQDLLQKSANSPGFLRFWSHTTTAYGPRGNKILAHAQWIRIGLEGAEDELIEAYLAQAVNKAELLQAGVARKYLRFKHIERWLKYHCWEDDLAVIPEPLGEEAPYNPAQEPALYVRRATEDECIRFPMERISNG